MQALTGWVKELSGFFQQSPQEASPAPREKEPQARPLVKDFRLPVLDGVGAEKEKGWVADGCPTVVHMMANNFERIPDMDAYTWCDERLNVIRKITFSELADRARGVAYKLTHEYGLEKGDRALLVFIPEGYLEFVQAFIGCLLAGVVAVPVYPPMPSNLQEDLNRMVKIVEMCDAKVALTTSKFSNLMIAARVKLSVTVGFGFAWPSELTWISVDKSGQCPDHAPSIRALVQNVKPEDLAFLQFTSGSTGFPKGVMVAHSCLNHNIACQIRAMSHNHSGETVLVGWLPLFHDFGLIGGVICGTAIGSHLVGYSPLDFLKDPLSWLKALSKFKATHTGAPNFALARCVKEWQRLAPENRPQIDLGTLASLNIGAEPIQEHVLSEFRNTFRPHGLQESVLVPSYGLAEHVVFLATGHDVELDMMTNENKVVVAGKPQFGVEVKIVDHTSCMECSGGDTGEIWVNSPSVAKGYWNLPDLSKEVFRAPLHGKEYLRTGDLGYIKNGHLYITGRLKDVIIVCGTNHYPQDIEHTIAEASSLVRPGRLAAFSMNEDQIGLVVEVADNKLTEKDIQDLFDIILSSVQRIHRLSVSRIKLVKARSIPRTTSGKIQRQQCKIALLEGKLHGVTGGDFDSSLGHPLATSSGELSSEGGSAADSLGICSSDGEKSIEEDFGSVCSQDVDAILKIICRGGGIPFARLDRHSSLLEMGIGSMQSFRIVNELQISYPDVTFATLLQPVSLDELARNIAGGHHIISDSDVLTGTPAPSNFSIEQLEEGVPISYNQARMVALHDCDPGSGAYVMPLATRLKGNLNIDVLEQSLTQLAQRHNVLIMQYKKVASGEVYQVKSHGVVRANVTAVDLTYLGDTINQNSEETAMRMLRDEARRPFDIYNEPSSRVLLLKVKPDEHLMLMCVHHIACDGISVGIIARDFMEIHNALFLQVEPNLCSLSMQYYDFSAWQQNMMNKGVWNRQLQFWKSQLDGAPPHINLPVDVPNAHSTTFGCLGGIGIHIRHQMVETLTKIAQERGGTLYMILLAAYQLMLSWVTERMDIIVGAPVGMASRMFTETEQMVGYMVNPLPIRMTVPTKGSFQEFFLQSRDNSFLSFENGSAPLHEIISAVGGNYSVGYHPIYQAILVLQGKSTYAPSLPCDQLKMEALPYATIMGLRDRAEQKLKMELVHCDTGLQGMVGYDADLYQKKSVSMWIKCWQSILEVVSNNPQVDLSSLRQSTYSRLLAE